MSEEKREFLHLSLVFKKPEGPRGSFGRVYSTQFAPDIFGTYMKRINWIYVWFRENMYIPKGKTKKTEANKNEIY